MKHGKLGALGKMQEAPICMPIKGILRSKMGLLRKMYNQINFIRTNRIQDDDVNHIG